ncbi:hypothetical protein HDV00_002380 [Rhizophlyctis rosea]|nr:hypothetical protein HDV00_002380 [Rhizophlyctis rosea]
MQNNSATCSHLPVRLPAPSRSPWPAAAHPDIYVDDHSSTTSSTTITPSTGLNRSASGLPALLDSQHSELYEAMSSSCDSKSTKSLFPSTPSSDSESEDTAPPSPSTRPRPRVFKRAYTFDGCIRSLDAHQQMNMIRLKLSKSNLSEDGDDIDFASPMEIEDGLGQKMSSSPIGPEILVSAPIDTGKTFDGTAEDAQKSEPATKRRTPFSAKPTGPRSNTALPYKSTKACIHTSTQKRRSSTGHRKSPSMTHPENLMGPPPPPTSASFQCPALPTRTREARTPPPGPRPVILSPRTIRGDRRHKTISTLEARSASPESVRILRGWQMGFGSIKRSERNVGVPWMFS